MIPSIPKVLPKSAPLFVPVALLIYLMLEGYDPTTAFFWAQLIIAMFNLSGLGIKISEMIIGLSAGMRFLALLFTMVTCLILGMGIPTTADYVLAASLAGPALVKLGVAPIAAHLFVFYFAVISAITPPVCAAVYAAVAIAGSNFLKTGWLAVRMGLSGFIAPYLFVYRPAVLLIGPPWEIIWASLVVSLAILALAGGVIGYFGGKGKWYENLMLYVGAGLLIKPGLVTDIMGLLIIAGLFLIQKSREAVIYKDLSHQVSKVEIFGQIFSEFDQLMTQQKLENWVPNFGASYWCQEGRKLIHDFFLPVVKRPTATLPQ